MPASHDRPNSGRLNQRPGRSDAPPGSQGGANPLLSSLCPNIRLAPRTIDAPIRRPPQSPSFRFSRAPPPPFALTAGKAGNPKKWTINFRRYTRERIPPAARTRVHAYFTLHACRPGHKIKLPDLPVDGRGWIPRWKPKKLIDNNHVIT